MKVDVRELRLEAIKSKYKVFPTKCACCGKLYKREKMWRVKRWGINKTTRDWFYCKWCMPTKEAVLYEIDTDAFMWGIAFIDGFNSDYKTDKTKFEAERESFMDKCPPPPGKNKEA